VRIFPQQGHSACTPTPASHKPGVVSNRQPNRSPLVSLCAISRNWSQVFGISLSETEGLSPQDLHWRWNAFRLLLPLGTGERGGQPIYTAIAIQTGLTVRLVLHQPLRQTEGVSDRSPTCSGLMGLSRMDHSLAMTASNQGQPVRLILARTPRAAAERRISRRRARCSGSM
jgi:hypothetical protein